MTSLPHLPERPTVVVDPDPLLSSVPGLMGFTPERSAVLMAFSPERVLLATMRLDLVFTAQGRPDRQMRAQVHQLGTIVAEYGAAGVVCVVADDRFDSSDLAGEMVRYGSTFRLVERSCRAAGGLSAGFVLPAFAAGAQWFTGWFPECRRGASKPPAPFAGPVADTGLLSDPALSSVALQRAVYNGRPVLAHRSDLAAILTPGPHCDSARCRPVTPIVPPAAPGPRDSEGAIRVLEVVRRAADRARGAELTLDCTQVNSLAEALYAVHTRDVLLALAVTELREAAEYLWIRLARGLRGRAGAAAATLLGHLHYLRGEGALASVAIERALELDPEYNLARLIDSALYHGMRPSALAEVVAYSFELGAELGVDLPPQVYAAAG
ncbi:hypothetical protein GOHSU_37_00260 [Gordonia hirsuta DSM 44140 = NBRC 16056]|uniref:Uncharacterized protein n=1 Tax=Gordonia hirsuta DSM 44140 = NBRC 16056 TaxID=1121927 RepID=L7LB18_9ACTN|nr:DUF4192 domain-containing protein [Gordonia hirsuta]GAC58330.1 hypothetical protein GOHSU_37_00260 [Gordonia hirsuta DSM 44140 = NBRC 16056]